MMNDACEQADKGAACDALKKTTQALAGDFGTHALGPLYGKNTLVSFLTNTLTPAICELLTEPGAFDKCVRAASTDKEALWKLGAEFDALLPRSPKA